MKLTLPAPQLLHEWRLRSFPENVAADYTLERIDGIDTDEIMTALMEDWYRNLLRNADTRLLNPVEIVQECSLEKISDRHAVITLPEGTLRVTEVVMEGWTGSALITADGSSRAARLQQSPYTCGTARAPAAVVSGLRVDLYPPAGNLISVKAIVDIPGVYALDSAAFATIQPFQ